MLINPRPGERVELRYRPALRPYFLHGRRGTVTVVGRGKPRNHGVEIEGRLVVVPCGNCFKVSE